MVTNARLTRFCPEERRDSIIAVAAEAFAQEGYGATSMSTIAARLGGSKATLYKYFPSKEQLFEAVMQSRCERVLAPLRDLRSSDSGDLESLLAGFGARFLTKIYEPHALDVHRLIQSEGGRFPELAEAFFRAGPNAVIEELRATLARFVASGQIACDDLTLSAGQFLGMLRGDRHLRFTSGLLPSPDAEEIARHARHAARIFVYGLQPRDHVTDTTPGNAR
jgi:AcrR family transcriptional regulator